MVVPGPARSIGVGSVVGRGELGGRAALLDQRVESAREVAQRGIEESGQADIGAAIAPAIWASRTSRDGSVASRVTPLASIARPLSTPPLTLTILNARVASRTALAIVASSPEPNAIALGPSRNGDSASFPDSFAAIRISRFLTTR